MHKMTYSALDQYANISWNVLRWEEGVPSAEVFIAGGVEQMKSSRMSKVPWLPMGQVGPWDKKNQQRC